MKTKLIYPLTMALAVAMAGAGCKHQPVGEIHMQAPPIANDQTPPPQPVPTPGQQPVPQPGQPAEVTLPPALPIQTEPPGVNSTNAGGSIPENYDFNPADTSKWTADAAALAASTVHFAFDSAVVRTTEAENVAAVAAYLTSNPNDRLVIEGNCDERGTEEYNRSLGERRALALREALAAKNISPKHVRTISYGKDKPVDPAHNDAAYAKNRRGDFVVYHPKTGAAM